LLSGFLGHGYQKGSVRATLLGKLGIMISEYWANSDERV